MIYLQLGALVGLTLILMKAIQAVWSRRQHDRIPVAEHRHRQFGPVWRFPEDHSK